MRIIVENSGDVVCQLVGIFAHEKIFKIEISCNKKNLEKELGSGLDSKGFHFTATVHGSNFMVDNSYIKIYVDELIYKTYTQHIVESPYSIILYLIPSSEDNWVDIAEQKNLNFGITQSLTGSFSKQKE